MFFVQTHPCKDVLQRAGEGGPRFILENVELEATAGGCAVSCWRAVCCMLSDKRTEEFPKNSVLVNKL